MEKFAQLVVFTAKGGSGAPGNQKHRHARRVNNQDFGNVFLLISLLGIIIGIIRPLYATPCDYHSTSRRPVYLRLFFFFRCLK